MKTGKRAAALLLALCLLLSCAACGGSGGSNGAASATAASMWLVKTEGTVAVTDDAGADVSLTERLGLFSGYGVVTQAASYGWIDLDETKLTKMDENSDVTVQKDGKNLTLTVNSGSLFFNVTEPLAADETMEIRCANMVTAIRGTCGWVEVPDAEHMNVYILEGTVECTAGDVTQAVTAGQCAALNAAEGTIAVDDFKAGKIPAFVAAEVKENEDLAAAILDASGLDVVNGGGNDLTAMLRDVYFGDPAACTMTPEQAGLMAGYLRDRILNEQESVDAMYGMPDFPVELSGFCAYARLFDGGNGVPALICASGPYYQDGGEEIMTAFSSANIYFFTARGGHSLLSGNMMSIYDDHIIIGSERLDGKGYDAGVYPLIGYDLVEGTAQTHASGKWIEGVSRGIEYTIDDVYVSREEFDAWRAQWDPGAEIGVTITGDTNDPDLARLYHWGLLPVEDVLAVLDAWTGGEEQAE